MNLIFIYGPPAAGKLTVANALSEMLGYRVYPNHEIIAHLATLFPYDDPKLSEIRKELARNIRLTIFKNAAVENISFVTTFGMSGARYFEFFRSILVTIENEGGKVHFVQLAPSYDELLQRVTSDSRKHIKIDSKEYLIKLLGDNPEVFDKFPDIEHLTVDNSTLSPAQTAKLVMDHYALSLKQN